MPNKKLSRLYAQTNQETNKGRNEFKKNGRKTHEESVKHYCRTCLNNTSTMLKVA